MKKIIFLLMLGIVTLNAGVYTSLTGLTMKSMPADKEWALDVVGEDVRVYEFVTKTAPHMKCVVIFSESSTKSPVMECARLDNANYRYTKGN